MNTRRHTLPIGWACLAIAVADIIGIHAHQGQPEAAMLLVPLVSAVLVAATAAKRARYWA
jgi:Na+/glutamate symporter